MLQIPLRKLDRLTPEPTELDRYEIASRDDIRALQRERLAWSLRHAYENVPHYRAKFDADYVLCGHVHEQYKIAREGYQLKDYVTNEHKDLGFTTKKIIVNVGVDVWNYTPVTLEQIFEEIENAK